MKKDNTSDALPEGKILNGRYRIWQKLGGGGFGITYLATVREAPVQGGLVVIKEHYPAWCVKRDAMDGSVRVNEGEQVRYEWSLDAFKHEAQQLSILNHPSIIRVADAFEENNTAYYVMPYVRGGSLADGVRWLRRKGQRLSQAAILKLLRTLLSALEHMHHSALRGVPVYHLDIKPGNILLTGNGGDELPVLIDFGSPEMGSPGFMPHEQRTPGAIGPWTDIYALAASMHKLLTGKTPAAHIDEACEALTEAPRQELLSQNEELLACYDIELLESIDRALSWDPARRFSDAAQWLRVLDGIPLRLPDYGVDLLHLMVNIRSNELVAPIALWDADDGHKMRFSREKIRNLAIFLASAGVASFIWLALLPNKADYYEESYLDSLPEQSREDDRAEQQQREQEAAAAREREKQQREKEAAAAREREKQQREEEAAAREREKQQREQEAAAAREREKQQREEEAAAREREKQQREKEAAAAREREKQQREEEAAAREREKRQREQEEAAVREREKQQREKEAAAAREREKQQREKEAAAAREREEQQREKEAAAAREREKQQREKEAAAAREREKQQREKEAAAAREREKQQREKAAAAAREREKQQREKEAAAAREREKQQRDKEAAAAREREKKQREAAKRVTPPSQTPIKTHVCPSNPQAARPGRPDYRKLQEGAGLGCPSCSSWLRALQNR